MEASDEMVEITTNGQTIEVNKMIYSMASGGNYPLKDCIIYVGDGSSITILK